jgi:WD40 repeat protein/serine/threonine protein kinase
MNERSIFAAALDIADPAERAAYLDKACGGQGDLRQHLDELLAAQAKLGSFLADPPSLLEKTAAYEPMGEGAASTIGPYKLLQQIGEGGMGIVYMAEQHEPVRRKVALKITKPGMDSTQVIARFEAERQALAMMDHQNIAKVFDAGTTETGRPYFVMELVHGIPLTSFCDDNRLTLRQRLDLFIPVCHAIQHAHQKGIIHRDVKPSNVLVTMYDDRPVPKVIDFGIAKATDQQLTERTMFTQFGAMVGTFEYMSPEQAEMNAFGVDTRSDIYSLGVLLYELLTGTTPLEKARLREAAFNEIVRIIKEEEPPRPSIRLSRSATAASIAAARKTEPQQLSKLVRGDLDWIVMRCLEKQRDRRYETANGLARDIERYLADEPVEARPPSAGYRLQKFIRRNKGRVVAAGLLLLALVLGIAGTTTGMIAAQNAQRAAEAQRTIAEQSRKAAESEKNQKEQERRRADAMAAEALAAKKKAYTKADEALEERQRAEKQLYANQITLADREWETNDVAGAWQYLDACREDFRGWEHNYLYTLFTQNQRTLRGHSGWVWSVAFSPDGKQIASGAWDGTLKLWDTATGKAIHTMQGDPNWVMGVAFSPDGKRLVSGGFYSGVLKVWDVATGRELLNVRGHRGFVNCVAFSPDGKRIASGSRDQTAKVWDSTNGKELLSLGPYGDEVMSMAFSPDGKRIAVGSDGVRICDASSGKELLKLEQVSGILPSVAFSPDGARIAGADGDLRIWDAASGRKLLSIGSQSAQVIRVAYSPDGRQVVGSCEVNKVKVWDAASGKETLALKGHAAAVICVAFSPDGKRIVSGSQDNTVKVWDATKSQAILTLGEHANPVTFVAFSPDGKRIVAGMVDAISGVDNSVRVWDGARGNELLRFEKVARMAYSPDGTRMAGVCGNLGIWDAKSGGQLLSIAGQSARSAVVAFSPDGRRIVSGHSDQDGTGSVKVWDATSGQTLLTLKGHNAAVTNVAFRPDGKQIASASNDMTVKLWDVQTGRELHTLKGHAGWVWSIAYSPDGKRLVSGSQDNTLKVWDAGAGQELLTLKGHTGQVFGVAYSPDGKRIASGSEDHSVKLWDAASGQETLTLRGHAENVLSVAFSPDGKRLASGSQDGTVKIWDASRGPEAAQ